MTVFKYIKRNQIFFLKNTNKHDSINELVSYFSKIDDSLNVDDIRQKIFHRETLMSTGIGLGIGIPHLRYKGILDPLVFLGIQKDGIPDYESIDKDPVKLMVIILVGENEHKEYLKILSSIVGFFKKDDNIAKLLSFSTVDDIYNFVTGELK